MTRPEAMSLLMRRCCGGDKDLDEQTNGFRHLGRGILTMVAAPAFQWAKISTIALGNKQTGRCGLARVVCRMSCWSNDRYVR